MVFAVINDGNNLRTAHRRKTTVKLIDLSRMFYLKITPKKAKYSRMMLLF